MVLDFAQGCELLFCLASSKTSCVFDSFISAFLAPKGADWCTFRPCRERLGVLNRRVLGPAQSGAHEGHLQRPAVKQQQWCLQLQSPSNMPASLAAALCAHLAAHTSPAQACTQKRFLTRLQPFLGVTRQGRGGGGWSRKRMGCNCADHVG
jgi:hypothetical protein